MVDSSCCISPDRRSETSRNRLFTVLSSAVTAKPVSTTAPRPKPVIDLIYAFKKPLLCNTEDNFRNPWFFSLYRDLGACYHSDGISPFTPINSGSKLRYVR